MLIVCEIYFPQNQNFDKSVKFIAHEIFALYGMCIISIRLLVRSVLMKGRSG